MKVENPCGIPYFIDTQATQENLKTLLSLVKELFQMRAYELPEYKEHEITDDTDFSNDLIIQMSTPYDDIVKRVLFVFGKLQVVQKRVMYYSYIKNYSFFSLQKGLNVESIEISSAFYHYKKALEFMTTTIQETIAYREV